MIRMLSFTLILIFFSTKAFSNKEVIIHYSDIAYAKYQDSLFTAEQLLEKVYLLLDNPSEVTMDDAKKAWINARVPYLQTEVYRFGNEIVDNWEGNVNAWPLDEGMIDYVAESYISGKNNYSMANVINNPVIKVNGSKLDTTKITADILRNSLQELGGNEANVAVGYHAIEFLLWGQDLNGTQKGMGNRSYNDYNLTECANTRCDRRRTYLKIATELLVSDLKEMANNWSQLGSARKQLIENNLKKGIKSIITGMGSLSYGELAGERIQLGLMLHDPEEEQDCFSDNTHKSHYYNALGIKNVYLGEYTRIDGSKMFGPSLSSLLSKLDKDLDIDIKNALDNTMLKMNVMVNKAEVEGESYDQMIGEGNLLGNKIVLDVVDALINQTKLIEKMAITLQLDSLEIEGSDSLDNPNAVFN